MTFEMIMAAMALAAKADKYNHPDYDAIEEKYRQEELELARLERELNEKYPKERYLGLFILRCTVFIPAYNKKVECLVSDRDVRVYNYVMQDNEKVYDLIIGDTAEYDSVEEGFWVPPTKFNDHTGELDKDMEELLGIMISRAIYKRDGNMQKISDCDNRASRLVKSEGLVYDKGYFKDPKTNTYKHLYSITSKGVHLREG